MSYFDTAFENSEKLISTAKRHLKGVDYDTMVGTGLSGSLVVPLLARALGKKFAIVRKNASESSHARTTYEGEIGQKWIFVDDFIASGSTRERVRETVQTAVNNNNRYAYHEKDKFATTFVGSYLYQDDRGSTPHFRPE
jgi:adenine/guanine phosphoribosyltransferase-like PRPP-binding protein